MRFKVPQYIEIEDKVIGPLTFKQFLASLGGAGILLILWFTLSLGLFIILAVPIGAIFGLIIFSKYQGRPLSGLVGPFIAYLTKPKLYLWKRKIDPELTRLLGRSKIKNDNKPE